MASRNFGLLARHLATAQIDLTTNELGIILVTALPSESNLDTWANRSDVTGIEVPNGSGYTTGGIVQPYTLDAYDTTNNRQPVTLTDIVNGWTSSTISAVGCIIFKRTGVAANDILLFAGDFGGTVTSTNGNFSVDHLTPFYINSGT
jgi:hypothetical protein